MSLCFFLDDHAIDTLANKCLVCVVGVGMGDEGLYTWLTLELLYNSKRHPILKGRYTYMNSKGSENELENSKSNRPKLKAITQE